MWTDVELHNCEMLQYVAWNEASIGSIAAVLAEALRLYVPGDGCYNCGTYRSML